MAIADPTGNNNSQADFGETVTLNLSIRNQGQGTLPASQLTLTTSDQYVSLVNSVSALPSISYYQDAVPTQPFHVQISANVPNLHTIPFNVHVQAGAESYDLQFSVVAHAPNLVLLNAVFSDKAAFLH